MNVLAYIEDRRRELAAAEARQTADEDRDLPVRGTCLPHSEERNSQRIAYLESCLRRRQVIRDEYMALERMESIERRRMEAGL